MAIVEATVCGVPVMASRVGVSRLLFVTDITEPYFHRMTGRLGKCPDFISGCAGMCTDDGLRGQEEMDARYSIDSTVRE